MLGRRELRKRGVGCSDGVVYALDDKKAIALAMPEILELYEDLIRLEQDEKVKKFREQVKVHV